MKTLQINTTQNVPINFSLANLGQRMGAFFIDNIIKYAYIYLLIEFLKYDSNAFDGDNWSVRAIDILVFLPIVLYSLYSEVLMNGQTIGKKLLKLKVVTTDGYKPSFTDYSIRWFSRIIDFNVAILIIIYIASLSPTNNLWLILFMLLIFGKIVGATSLLLTKDNQRIGDIAANTVVIHLKDDTSFSQTILENLKENYIPKYPTIIKLSDNDARIIKDTFVMAKKSKDYKTLQKLRLKIEEVTAIKSSEENDTSFIDKVLKDYNYYTQNM